MALVLKDRVKETTSTVGTGTYALSGAVAGFQSFGVIGNANTTYYAITDGTDWEVGIGTYTASGTTLSRDTILESSNAGSAVNWAFGVKDIFVTYPAERAVYLNGAGTAVDALDVTTLDAATANITTANITAGTVSTTPTSNTDLVNKLYVDTLVSSGIHFHTPVRVESPINLNATYNNGTAGVGATLTNAGTQAALVIDGVTVSVNDRVLVYQQTTQTQNGIYTVTNVGSGSTNWVLTRATDADSYVIDSPNGLSEGSTVFVQQGTTGAGETYTCNTTGTITFGTTNITFVQISSAQIYSAGTGLTLTGTQFSLSNVGTAATYGSASQVPVFTTNAQGQVSSVTNTSIAISGSAITSGTVAIANGGTGASTADNALTNLGATTVGANLFKLTNPGAIRFPRFNADNSVSSLSDTDFRTAIGAGTGTVTSVGGTGTVNGITLTGTVTSSGNLTLGGALTGVNLTSQVTGTLPIANGGSGQTTAQAAMNAFAGATTSGSYLRGNGTNVVMSTIQAADVPTLNQNTTGSAATLTTARTIQTNLASTSSASFNGSANITPGVTGTLPVANGGTGVTTSTGSGSVVLSTSPTLTTPVLGTPTSGTLSNCTVDGTDAVGFRNTPVNSQSAAYTLVLTDAGKTILHPISDNNARTFTIPANASVAYPVGTVITFVNLINTVTIAITSDTMYLAGPGTTGSRTLAAYGVATAVKLTSTSWLISGNGLT